MRDPGPLTAHLLRDAILVAKTTTATKSHFGGRPPLPPHRDWPTWNGRCLTFLACVDCGELPRSAELDWIPESGLLLFFYDAEEQPWGFDPKDRGGSAVIYVPVSEIDDRASIASPPTAPLPAEEVLPLRHVTFRLTKLPPSWQTHELDAVGLTDAEMDLYRERRVELYGNQPAHQIGGYPDPVQSADMDEECQLVTHGINCGGFMGVKDPSAEKLREAAGDWSLLFQIETDHDLEVMWGDAGMLYFWVRRDDARNLRFEGAWAILQCY